VSAGPRPTVVVFCKAPVPGRLKTRLTAGYAPDEAAALGMAMFLDVVHAVSAPAWNTVASVARDEDRGAIAALLPGDVGVSVQPEGDLGERMAFEIARHGHGGRAPVAIVGSDCPEISRGHVARAFGAIDDGADAAICPSDDGGYSIIAAHAEVGALLRDIPWSTADVARLTLAAAHAAGIRLDSVDRLPDIDRVEDVLRLVGDETRASEVAARTRAVAVALGNKRPGLALPG